MRALTRYIGWELVAIHAFTGALFLCVNVIILRGLMPERWILALCLVPLAAFSWWGWYAETRYVISASRNLRDGSSRSSTRDT